ncbi:MAG: hypothetical protein QOH31_5722 [Verrucomicrobiota bacterium]|jgi:hypothetical protein
MLAAIRGKGGFGAIELSLLSLTLTADHDRSSSTAGFELRTPTCIP